MSTLLTEHIASGVSEAGGLYHRLVLVVGPPRCGKTSALQDVSINREWPLFNVSLRLSEALLELTVRQRAVRTPQILADIASSGDADVVLLDNIEILFSVDLSQDPLRLLQGLSRNRTVVATWTGTYDGTYLTYAEPGHPEARKYIRPEAIIVPIEGHISTEVHGNSDGHSGIQETV